MKKLLILSLAALPVLTTAGITAAADMATAAPAPAVVESDRIGGVRIGYLDCQIGGGVGYVLGSAKTAAAARSFGPRLSGSRPVRVPKSVSALRYEPRVLACVPSSNHRSISPSVPALAPTSCSAARPARSTCSRSASPARSA